MVLWRLEGAVSVMTCSVDQTEQGASLTIRRGPHVEFEEIHATTERACLAAAALRRELLAMGFRAATPFVTAHAVSAPH